MSKVQAFALSERSFFTNALVAVLAAALILSLLPIPVFASHTDISITSTGFSPSNLNVMTGEPIHFFNNDTVTHNVSSNDHPTHTLYPILNLGDIAPGSSRTVTINTAGTYAYHDHLFSSRGGTITVSSGGGGDGSGTGGIPAAPSSLRQTGSTSSSITLAWNDNSSNEDKFMLERKLSSSGSYSFIYQAGTNITTYTDNSVTSGSNYDYRVQACQSGFGCSAYTYVYGVTPTSASDTSAPSMPTGFTVNSISSSRIDLAWAVSTDNVGVVGYKIYRCVCGSDNLTYLTSTSSLTFSESALSAFTTYTFAVAAYDAAGNVSARTAAISATTFASSGGTSVPATPTNLTGTYTSAGAVSLTWLDNATNETEYKVYEKLQPATAWNLLITIGANMSGYSYTTAATGTHEYYVIACNSSGCSGAPSTAVTVGSTGSGDTTAPSVPPVPTLNIVSSSQITLSWPTSSDNVGVSGYKIYRCVCGNSSSMVYLTSVTGLSYSDTGLSSSTTHTYAIAAYDAAGNTSPQGPAASGTTFAGTGGIPAAPTNLAATVSGSNVNLTWKDNSNNEAGFKIYRGPTWTDIGNAGANVTSFTDSGRPAGTYTYHINAFSSSNVYSVLSNDVSITIDGTADIPPPSGGAPNAPSGLALDPAPTSTAIYLKWDDKSDNETKFAVERTLTGTGGWTFLSFVGNNITNYTDGGITSASRYDYRVQACRDSYGCSAYIYLYNVSSTGTAANQPTPKVESWGASVGSDGKSTIAIGFNTEMDRSTFTAQNVFLHKAQDPATVQVPGTMQTSDFYVNLISSAPLVAGVEYISVVKASVRNKAGASLTADYSCKFTALASGYYAGCPAGTLAPAYRSTLTGTINDSSGKAIANVGVHVFAKDFSMSFGGSSASDGSYLIKLPAGMYNLELFPPAGRSDLIKPPLQSFEVKEDEVKRVNFQFGLASTGNKTISGTIKFSNGQPVADAQVGAYNETTNYWVDAPADAQGNYRLSVSTGKFKISFRPRDPMTASWQWPGIFRDVEFFGEGSEAKVLDFLVPVSDTKVTVSAVDDAGLPLANAGIMLEVEGNPPQYRRSEADGRAVFLVSPGKYLVRGYMPVELGFVNPNPQSIEVGSSETKEITLKFGKLKAETSLAISGKVQFENGSPASSAFIWGWSEQGGNAYSRANENGEFSITIPHSGFWRLGAGREVDGFPYKSSEVTISTEFETTGIALILAKYSSTAFPKPVDIVKSVVETIVAQAQDGAQVVIPSNAAGTSGTVNVKMTPTIEVQSTSNAKIVGTVWEIDMTDQIGAEIKTFTDDIEITFPYDEGSLLTEGVNIDALKPNYYDETTGAWVEINDYTVDKDSKSFIIRVNHLTRFALVAPADTTPPAMPSEFTYQLTGATQVTLVWVDPKADFHHTRVSRTENKLEAGSILSELVTAGKYVDSAVSIGKTYYYYLEAVDAAGNSSAASELLKVSVTGSTSGPSTPTATGVSAEKYPSGLLFKYANNATVYLLQNGVKYPITDFSVFKNHVSGSRSIVTVPSSVTFDSGNNVTLKSGTLIKAKSDPTVFLVIENKKRPFTSAEEFLGLGYRFHQVQAIDNTAVAAMETTSDLARPSATIFKYAGKSTIYMLEDGKKRAFPSTAVLKAWIDPTYVITMPDSEVYPDGTTMGLPSGALVRGSTATIYLVFDSTLRPLSSSKIMTSLGFKSSQVIRVSASDIKLHPVGEPIN